MKTKGIDITAAEFVQMVASGDLKGAAEQLYADKQAGAKTPIMSDFEQVDNRVDDEDIMALSQEGNEMAKTEQTKKDYTNNLFLTIPANVGSKDKPTPSVEYFINDKVLDKKTGKPKMLAEVTLPKGTEVNGKDVSYYTMLVDAAQVDPGKDGQKYPSTHSILVSVKNPKGEDYTLTLKKTHRKQDPETGKWATVVDDKIKVPSVEIKEALDRQYESYKEYRAKTREQEPDRGSLSDKGQKLAVAEQAQAGVEKTQQAQQKAEVRD